MLNKKIVILTNDTMFTYKHRKEIIESLCLKNYEVVIVCRLLQFQEEFIKLGCRLVNINNNRHSKNPLKDIGLFWQYYKILKKEKPNLVLSFHIKPNIYGGMACRLLNIPYIVNITGLGTAVEYPGKLQKLTVSLYKIALKKVNTIFFQNVGNQNFFEEHKLIPNKAKTVLLPGSGVNLTEYQPLPYDQTKTINFLFTARILKEKGIDLYLNVAKIVKTKYPNTCFHICGDCDDKKYVDIIKEFENKGYVKWHGEQKDMKPFLLQTNCVIHPSYYPEGMSNVLLEAAASARPIITTNRNGCKEIVEDGKTGFVIPIKDEQALLNAIYKFLNLSFEQQKQMGILGRQKIEKEFDRQLVVDKYLEIIKILLNEIKK